VSLELSPGRFADLLLSRPPRESRAAVLDLVEAGAPPRGVYLDVLGPALEEVGARWQAGRATVAQEHLATAIVSSIMASVAPRLEEPPPVGRRVVLASTDGEMHVVGLRMIGDFLEADGWEVYFLGAATPGPALQALVDETRPDAVGLSTTLTTHLAAAREAIAALRARPDPPFIFVGGNAYRDDLDLAGSLGADASAADAGAASRLLRARFEPL
jgi:methanogenic corrinoid protein MtbC1